MLKTKLQSEQVPTWNRPSQDSATESRSNSKKNYLKFWKLLVLLLFMTYMSGYGQTNLYQFSSSSGTYTPLVSPTLLVGSDLQDSWASPLINIGFNFVLDGVTYTQFSATSNGWVRLGSVASAYTNTPISSSNSGPAIAFFARDGKTSASGISYQVSGAAPNQILTIEYTDYWVYYANSINLLSAQIKLYEGTNKIEIVYGNNSRSASFIGQIGIVGSTTSDFNNRTTTLDWSATSEGYSNSNTVTWNTTVGPTSGLTYSWGLPTCIKPTAVNAANITSTTADITWTDINTTSPAGGWLIEYGPAYFAQGTGTVLSVPAGTSSQALSGLTPNTNYDVYVRSICTAGTDTSAWSNVERFLTTCLPISTFPYTEGFNSITLPSCYTTYEGSPIANRHWEAVTADAINGAAAPSEGSHFLRMHYYLASATYNPYYLGMPDFTLDAIPKEATFDIWLGSTSGTNHLKFEVSTNGGSTWTALQTYSANPANSTSGAPWEQKIVDLSAYANQTIKLRLNATSNYGSGYCNVGFDNFEIHDISSCQAPTGLTTSSVTAVSATLNWAASGTATATDYNWILVAAGAGPTGTPVASGSTTGSVLTASATGLTGNTAYDFYVQTDCGSGSVSSWSVAHTFTTACGLVTDFIEDFESTTGSAFPSCWAKVGAGGIASTQSSGSNRQLYMYSTTPTNIAVVSMQGVSTGSLGTYRLRFKAKANYTPGGVVEVGYLTIPTDPNTFTAITSFATTSTSVFDDFSVNNITLPTGVTTLAFRHSTSPAYSVIIDDVVYELTPSCFAPTSLTNSFTSTSATVSWTDINPTAPSGGWVIEYGAPGFTLGTGTSILVAPGPTTATITGLTPDTHYEWYVRAICIPGSDSSAWSLGAGFFTGYCPPAPSSVDDLGITNVTFGLSPNIVNNTTMTEPNNYGNYSTMIGDMIVGFTSTVSVQYTTNYTYGTKIWIDLNDDLVFDDATELLYTGLSASASPTVLNCPVTIPATALTGNHRMRIGGTDDNNGPPTPCYTGTYGSFEDYTVNVLAPPNCLPPTSLVATNIAADSADLGWTDPNATPPTLGWEIEFGPTGFTQGTGTSIVSTTNPFLLSGLTGNTQYDFYVRAICAVGDTSLWSSSATFTTLCSPVTVYPYTEGFNASIIPSCYSVSEGSPGSSVHWESVTADATHGAGAPSEGSNFMRMPYFSALTLYNTYNLNTPTFVLDATAKEATFDIWMGDASGAQNLDFDISTNGGLTWTTLQTYDANVANNNSSAPWESKIVDLSSYVNQTVNFRLAATSNYGSGFCNVGFDNFMVHDIPSCRQPVNVFVDNETSSTADINWSAPSLGTPVSYHWAVVQTGLPLNASNYVASGTTNHISGVTNYAATATGLSPNISYDAYVLTDCGGMDSSAWVGPLTFTTICAPFTTFPQTENFDNTPLGEMPTCWTRENTNADPQQWGTSNTNSCSSPNSLMVSYNIMQSMDDWAFSPFYTLNPSDTYRVSFTYSNNSSVYKENLEMMLSTGTNSTAATAGVLLFKDDSFSYDNTCHTVVVDFVPPAAGDFTFGFHGYSITNQYRLYIDDFSIDVSPGSPLIQVANNANNNVCAPFNLYGVAGTGWHPLLDATGNIIASIDPMGNNLGNIVVKTADMSVTEEMTSVSNVDTVKFVPRTFSITPEFAPTGPVKVRLYYEDAEMTSMNSSPLGTGVSTWSPGALYLVKYDENTVDCDAHNNTSQGVLLPFTIGGASGLDFYTEFEVSSFSEFYLQEQVAIISTSIEIENLQAKLVNDQIALTWNINDGEYGENIEIQKYVDNQWKSISTRAVNSSGNYAYDDRDVLPNNIYRIKHKNKYSNIVTVTTDGISSVSIHPNPAHEYVNINLVNQVTDLVMVKIYDMMGRLVLSRDITTSAKEVTEKIDIHTLSSGSYLLSIDNGISTIFSTALLKR